MADTKHPPAASPPVEGDGVNYGGLVWFVVILTAVTVVCQVLMWGLLAALETRADRRDVPRAPLAAPQGQAPPGPNLLAVLPDTYGEPAALKDFRAREDAILNSYGWVDLNAGTVRIPIHRAKDLLLERGLPVRDVKK